MSSFLIILAFLPGLFGYGSKAQAYEACKKWVNEGVKHEYRVIGWKGEEETYTLFARSCAHEPETRQYLGFEYEAVKNAKVWRYGKEKGEQNILKNFRY